jgi:hypothetical protein
MIKIIIKKKYQAGMGVSSEMNHLVPAGLLGTDIAL